MAKEYMRFSYMYIVHVPCEPLFSYATKRIFQSDIPGIAYASLILCDQSFMEKKNMKRVQPLWITITIPPHHRRI